MTDFWQGKRVTMTGAGGFLGRHLHKALLKAGAEVLPITHTIFDLRDSEDVKIALWGHDGESVPEVLFHLAANVGGIGKNRRFPADIMRDNLLMNTNILHACQMARVRKVVTVGSVCAYPARTPTPFREHNLFEGYPEVTNAPYGITKRALLVLGHAYRDQYDMNIIHAMPTNLYGPGDDFSLDNSHVIPAMMRKMHEAKHRGLPSITLWGDGRASREFLYVEDAAAALLLLGEKYDGYNPINIGTMEETRIDQLAGLMVSVTGYKGDVVWDDLMPNGQQRRTLDIRQILKLGWMPHTHIEAGLHKTYGWYQEETAHV